MFSAYQEHGMLRMSQLFQFDLTQAGRYLHEVVARTVQPIEQGITQCQRTARKPRQTVFQGKDIEYDVGQAACAKALSTRKILLPEGFQGFEEGGMLNHDSLRETGGA